MECSAYHLKSHTQPNPQVEILDQSRYRTAMNTWSYGSNRYQKELITVPCTAGYDYIFPDVAISVLMVDSSVLPMACMILGDPDSSERSSV